MKILIAPDSFKESLSARDAARAIAEGFRTVMPDAELVELPVGDGGEGTTEAMLSASGGNWFTETVTDPLGNPVQARWAMLGDRRTAVIECAAASGLALVPPEARDARLTTTRGTGELIRAALDQGASRFVIALGGSATNDAGAGLLQALGARLLDANGNDQPPGGGVLEHLDRIDLDALDPRLANVSFSVACDVDNPLVGDNGASAIFGPQKGADAAAVQHLDRCLDRFADVALATTGIALRDEPGAGAAGGLGAAFLGFFNAELRPGIDIVLDTLTFERHLRNADLVVTGEGCLDGQTVRGKTPVGVSRRALRAGVPTIALAGAVNDGADVLFDHGIVAVHSIVRGVTTLADALENAEDNLRFAARNLAATWCATVSAAGDPNGRHEP
ncbi:glycerate kinase [Marinobacter sp. JSM 1782161]|uniref:glycerate kinase n=1 Tax=Marinobacter sp. JSM 1782161 TaxID=2685906 RepID=UPI0014041B39|nr:glycerate kinase [Marinobacter sp. JSM 1782161]